jgi:hypothetical protein
MSKVKGYYNVNNGVFLGPVTVTMENGAAITPRYMEGICFGEYNTITNEFVPETNPMVIPRGSIRTENQDFDANGNLVSSITGIVEDVGTNIARKKLIGFSKNTYGSSNVETRDGSGRVVQGRFSTPVKQITNTVEPKEIKPVKESTVLFKGQIPKDQLPDIDFDKLFAR